MAYKRTAHRKKWCTHSIIVLLELKYLFLPDNILTTRINAIDLFTNDTITLWEQNESCSSKCEIPTNNQPVGSMAIFAYSFLENGKKKTEKLNGRKISKINNEECTEDMLQAGCISNIPKGAIVEKLGNILDDETLLKKLSGGNQSNDFTLGTCEYDLDSIGEKI